MNPKRVKFLALQNRVMDQLAPLSDAAGPTVFAVRSIIQAALERYQKLLDEEDI